MFTQILKRILVPLVLIGALFAGCSKEAEKVDFNTACGGANESGIVTVEGYVKNDSTTCSPNMAGSRDCSLTLSEDLDENLKVPIFFSLAEGAKGNQVETQGTGGTKSSEKFSRENIRIRSDNGSIINIQEKVAVSGDASLLISSSMAPVCVMEATKIKQSK